MNTESTPNAISSYTLHELITMAGGTNRPGVLGECVATTSDTQLNVFQQPSRIDAIIIGVGTEGETRVSLNLREYRLRENSLFIFGPKNILQVNSNDRFKAQVLAVTPNLMRILNIDTKHTMPLFIQLSSRPCIELAAEECRSLRNFIQLIKEELDAPETEFEGDVIQGLISASINKVCTFIQRYLTTHPEAQTTVYNRTEIYFKQFIELLGEHFREERSVGFYAQQMCITPKYLTTVIKRVSGRSVSEWIDNYVVLEAKTLLRYSNMSVQEVAYNLNFPNQSFFGSYFKRITGQSPSQFKCYSQSCEIGK